MTGIFVSAVTVLWMVTKISRELAVLYFLQIPLQYFGFQKLLNGEKSRLSQYSSELQNIVAKNNKNIKAVISDVNSIKQYGEADGILSFIGKSMGNITKMERKANSYVMDMRTVLEYLSLLLKNSCFLFITCLYITDRVSNGDLVYLNLINDIYYTSISEVINIQINLRDLHGAAGFVSEEIEANYEEDGHIILESIATLYALDEIGKYEEAVEILERYNGSRQYDNRIAWYLFLSGKKEEGRNRILKHCVADQIFVFNDLSILAEMYRQEGDLEKEILFMEAEAPSCELFFRDEGGYADRAYAGKAYRIAKLYEEIGKAGQAEVWYEKARKHARIYRSNLSMLIASLRYCDQVEGRMIDSCAEILEELIPETL